MPAERLQKILARVGLASRRKAESLIADGLVTVNGKVAKIGDKATFGKDAIKVNGKLIHQAQSPIYLALNKPKGVISALVDPEGRATLSDFISKIHTRVFPIGRLDFNSEGLLLLTNDGDFAEKVQKRDDIARVYHVKVKGHPNAEMLKRLERGMKVGNRFVRPHSVRISQDLEKKSRVEFVLLSPGAVDVKAYFEDKGFLVERITRTALGHITIKGLLPGEYRLLKASQVLALLNQPELGMRKLAEDAEKGKRKGVGMRAAERERDQLREEEAEAKRARRAGPKRVIKIVPVAVRRKAP